MPSFKSITEALVQFSVPRRTAEHAALNELRNWSIEAINAIFTQLSPELYPFAMSIQENNDTGSPTIGISQWIKPPLALLRRSATERAALCINASGEWSIRASGYMTISHVWKEGLQATEEGFSRLQLIRVFEALARVGLEPEFLWLDVLAIPTSGPLL